MSGRGLGARLAWILAGVLGLATGCAHYVDLAEPIAAETVLPSAGWVVAGATPTVLQVGEVDCGPAALAMVAGRWQTTLTLAEAAAGMPAGTPDGMRLGELRDVARRHGLEAFAIRADRETLRHELEAARPVIVGLVRRFDSGHAVSHYEVVVAMRASPRGEDDDEIATIDPGRGWQVRRFADLDAEWEPAGRVALVVVGVVE